MMRVIDERRPMRNSLINSNLVDKFTDGVVIDHPHKLKPGQIAELNNVVSTLAKYEHTLSNLTKISLMLYHAYLDTGQDENSEVCDLWLTLRDIRTALEPLSEDGDFNEYHGLVGHWNKEKKSYDRYR